MRVVDERKARGTLERTYALVASSGAVQAADLQSIPVGQVRSGVRNFIAHLSATALAYVGSRSFSRDRAQFRSFVITADLTDEEFAQANRAIIDAVAAAKKRSAGGTTTRRSFYLVALPEDSQ